VTDATLTGQHYWDKHAAADPLWAVLSFADKSGGRWALDEFMGTGEREIALLFHRFAELQLRMPGRRALDFGCGVGRLTQALARRHQRVLGADISPVMIVTARRLNRYPERAEYLCTARAGLETLPDRSFDCIYSNIVLQHVAPETSVRYLHEFFRLLEPGGLLVFQLPSGRAGPRWRCRFSAARADVDSAQYQRPHLEPASIWTVGARQPLARRRRRPDAAARRCEIAVAAGRSAGSRVAGAIDDACTGGARRLRRRDRPGA
jgi:SAM-dependent methyltransferase